MDTQLSHERAGDAPDPRERALRLAQHFNGVARFDEAEREAVRGLAQSADDLGLQLELVRSFLGRERWDEAEETLCRMLARAPEFPVAHNLLAVVHMSQGRYAEAEKGVLEALRLDPDWASPYEVYGDLMLRTSHLDKAKRLYERARAIDPEDADLPSKIALVESQQSRIAPAHAAAADGLALGPDEAIAHASRGQAHFAGGRPFRARADFREALRIDPTNAALEAAWLEADTACRVVYLPMYYWSLVTDRLPGRQFLVWGLFLAFTLGASKMGVPPTVVGVIAIAYITLCIYTWFASPLVNVWKRLVPPKL